MVLLGIVRNKEMVMKTHKEKCIAHAITRFEENPNYKAGNNQTWIHRKYKNNIVLLHYCKTDNGQWYNWPPGMEEAYIKGLREKIE